MFVFNNKSIKRVGGFGTRSVDAGRVVTKVLALQARNIYTLECTHKNDDFK